MKRSRCPSSVAQPFNTPAAAGGAPRLGGGGAPTGAGPSEGGFGLKKERASKMIARKLVRTAAKDDERPDDAPVEAADKAASPRQPLGPVKVAVGQPASSSTRKAFKPPIKKDSEMADMYGQSSKSLGGRPAPARQARYSPHLEGALVLYTPPPETCSEDVPPPDRHVHVVLDPHLSLKLRPHQREGVTFIFEACRGKPGALGRGCILADDMGLGKTLQTISVLWTLLKQGPAGKPDADSAIVMCPTSLVLNWAAEVKKWLGDKIIPTVVTSDMKKEKIETRLRGFIQSKNAGLLLASYETLSGNLELMKKREIGVLVCDEAHRLKNVETKGWKDLIQIRAKTKIMVTGTPVQNDLNEFYALLAFCMPECLGSMAEFRKKYALPISKARDVGASDKEIARGKVADDEFREKVQTVMLRRGNEAIAKYLPPKYEMVVFCSLTDAQKRLYTAEVEASALAKEEGKGGGAGAGCSTFKTLTTLRKLTSHPQLIADSTEHAAVLGQIGCLAPASSRGGSGSGGRVKLNPALSGKMATLHALLHQVKKTTTDRWVLVSNFTQTLDLFEELLKQGCMGFQRLDGSVNANKRQVMVDSFNADPTQYAFLLSSKAGGCGLNLIGANRLILFDPDWNPANDAQAMARVWRSGQTKTCYVYRFLGTGTIEEKTWERQLSKEGLAGQVVEGDLDKRKFSAEELRELFTPDFETRSTCHDSLGCQCCNSLGTHKPGEDENGFTHLLPGTQQLRACDASLASVKEHVSLVFSRKTDHSGGVFGASSSTATH